MLKLYQREGCPFCKPVRQLLTDLNITYINVNVPFDRGLRQELIDLTGVPYIPALVDGNVVVKGQLEYNQHIIDYINENYQ